jgi:alpha-galactosidase
VTYEVRPFAPGDDISPRDDGAQAPAWWKDGARLSGRTLGVVGLQVPNQFPERSVLLHVRSTPEA